MSENELLSRVVVGGGPLPTTRFVYNFLQAGIVSVGGTFSIIVLVLIFGCRNTGLCHLSAPEPGLHTNTGKAGKYVK